MILTLNSSGQLCKENFQPIFSQIDEKAPIYKHMHNYAKTNIAKLNIFIRDPYYEKLKRDEQMTFVSFVGNAGGLMSLCLGLSVLSLFELAYFTVIIILKRFRISFGNPTNAILVDE
jgi:Amiloride-sensitive sodium channel